MTSSIKTKKNTSVCKKASDIDPTCLAKLLLRIFRQLASCRVKDKSLDCQGISLEVMIFIAAEGISAKEERHCRQVCSNRINPFKNSDIQISICNIRGRGLFWPLPPRFEGVPCRAESGQISLPGRLFYFCFLIQKRGVLGKKKRL